MEEQVVELKQDLQSMTEITNFRPGRYITPYGGYSLASRRNIAHCSAQAAAKMIAGDSIRGGVQDKKQ